MVVGVIVVSFRVSPIPPLVRVASWFVSFFRNTPLLVVFFLALFGLGDLGLVYDFFPTAATALGLYTGRTWPRCCARGSRRAAGPGRSRPVDRASGSSS